jgi:hypothetical protein
MKFVTSLRARWDIFSQTFLGDLISTAIPIATMFAILAACATVIYVVARAIEHVR